MKYMVSKSVLSMCVLFTMVGCSNDMGNEIIYGLTQPNSGSESRCRVLAPHKIDECLSKARNGVSYEQYKKKREEILNGNL